MSYRHDAGATAARSTGDTQFVGLFDGELAAAELEGNFLAVAVRPHHLIGGGHFELGELHRCGDSLLGPGWHLKPRRRLTPHPVITHGPSLHVGTSGSGQPHASPSE